MPAPPLPASQPITRFLLKASLLGRLNAAQFWTDDELTNYVNQALIAWQAYSHYWRSPVSFSTHVDGGGTPQSFYDVSVEVPQLARTVTDSAVLSLIEYHLLEPQSGITSSPAWAGTSMWAQGPFLDSMTRRRNRFLEETASVIQHFSTPTIDAGTTRVVLQGVLETRRVSWVDATGNQTLLWRDDEFAANSYNPNWMVTPDTPVIYSLAVTQPFTLQLIPPPVDIGFLDILAIAPGPAPLVPSTGVVLGIPDNYQGAISFGTMADLLSQDGPATDIQRAEYANQRYLEYVQLCRNMPTVINASINGNSCQLDSVFNFDAYNVGWNVAGPVYNTPSVLALAGQTILAVDTVPDPANPSSIGFDAVINCPVPATDSLPIALSADIYDLIVDEAEHLALFKEGGQEFQASLPLHRNFIQRAALELQMSGLRAPYMTEMKVKNQVEFSGRRMFR